MRAAFVVLDNLDNNSFRSISYPVLDKNIFFGSKSK